MRARKWKVVLWGVTIPIVLGVGVYSFYSRPREFQARQFLSEGVEIAPAQTAPGQAVRAEVEVERLETDVAYLASVELGGRQPGTDGSRLAREYLVERLEGLALAPVFAGGSYEQEIRIKEDHIGTNVAAMIPGQGEANEAIVFVAHYDHLGVVDGEVHLGADDNASGVALGLEVARLIMARKIEPLHDLVFLFPDTEEPPYVRTEKMGSSFFVDHGPYPPERLRLAVVADVMASAPIPGGEDFFFVLGAENSPDLVRLVREVPQPKQAAQYKMMSVAMIESIPYLARVRRSKSDYHAFRLHDRPFLFLTSGTGQTYHQPTDTAETLHYEKLAAETGFVADLLIRAAADEKPIEYLPDSVDPVQDIAITVEILQKVLANPGNIDPKTLEKMKRDQVTLFEFRDKVNGGEPLTDKEYWRLTIIGLRLQCALTRPDYSMCHQF